MRSPAAVLLAALFLLMPAACRTAPAIPEPTPVCVPSPTAIDEASGYPEIEFPASEGTLWALLQAPGGEFHAGAPARILWKMTNGRGDIRLTAIHESGARTGAIYGPISREYRSQWRHEGQEWGSAFIFPLPGCWRLLASRWLIKSDIPVTGQIEIQVSP
ncbi:MAG TPA: hypothetical protein VIV15_00005 [Anaerolineales bacterium]